MTARRDVPSTWTPGAPANILRDVCHILKRGERSFCGAVTYHRWGWAIGMVGALDPLAWEAVQTRAPNALCAECCRRAKLLGRVPS